MQILDHALDATQAAVSGQIRGTPWTVYVAQNAQVSPPVTILGRINLNPNNSPHNEFLLTKPDGTRITRDDLHQNAPVDVEGCLYIGSAAEIRVKPKGNGQQNDLTIDGENYALQNSNTYVFNGDELSVRLHNDQVGSNGKAMGHWWIEISGMILLDDVVTLPHRLVQFDHVTGTVTEVMAPQRNYDALALGPGHRFYATSGDRLYVIDPLAETEASVGPGGSAQTLGLEFAGDALGLFDAVNDRLAALSTITGVHVSTPMILGATDLGTIVFVPRPLDPALLPDPYE